MKKITCHGSKVHIWFLAATLVALFISFFFLPNYVSFQSTGDNMFVASLNGTVVGTVETKSAAENCLREARRENAKGQDSLVYVEANLEVEGKEVIWGRVDDEETVTENMLTILRQDVADTLESCYAVKINEYTINVKTKEDVLALLTTTLERYDINHQYVVNLVLDPSREINVLTSQVISAEEQELIEEKEQSLPTAGIEARLSDIFSAAQPAVGKDFDDYVLGLQTIDFGEKIEVVPAYMPKSSISSLNDAIDEVTKDQEKNQIYEVQSGDTLSGIADRYSLSMDQLIGMNSILTNADSAIRVGDELTVTVPTPELSVVYTRQEYYEEDYEEDVIYVDNDTWYTSKQEVVQEPSTGHRRVIAKVEYKNDDRVATSIVKQEATAVAVPKIIERGTKVPPTYIWPVSGGTISSGFGGRNAPKAGASTNHKGVDIALPIGTSVMASSGGTVTVAGWQSGYGNVVYITHSDGRETRYGHLSRVLVSVGQTVSQGQKIALSGNTGNSTGPHLHFEMRINGTPVNPLSNTGN